MLHCDRDSDLNPIRDPIPNPLLIPSGGVAREQGGSESSGFAEGRQGRQLFLCVFGDLVRKVGDLRKKLATFVRTVGDLAPSFWQP